MRNKKQAREARRFLMNLFILFDGHPPLYIERAINDILDLLD